MRIVILGAGRMGAWLVEEFCHDHHVAVFDTDPKKLKYFINVTRFLELSEIKTFKPELLINAVNLKNTIEAFD
ncbi:MAG: prephenate dehydrogenase/arogenate dehydrogenase family protein, partial [Candidatus Marinimicrobia bacterium]|nr:prephenate dehydrogenase/arogenate dehydrogenase family protein [Candidatus Neomarinimicrobiota bacterium]